MSLLDLVRSGVALAAKLTEPLQAEVQYRRMTGVSSDGYKRKQYAAPVPLKALVDFQQKPLRTAAGVESTSRTSVQFLDIAALQEATGGAGIGEDDLIILPDGSTGPILDIGGFIDAGTGQPFATVVFLG